MYSRCIIALMVAIVSILLCAQVYAGTQLSQTKVFYYNEEQLKSILEMGLDVIGGEDNYLIIVSSQEEIQTLSSMGYEIEIIHDDLVKFYQSRLDVSKDMGGYKTLSELNAYTDNIIADHSDIVSSKISIGQTIEGRDIWAFKVSDNPEVDEDEPEILFTSLIHAREVITPEVLFYFIDHITDNYATDADIQELINNREIWFIICCNPDGYYRNEFTNPNGGGMWRKNRRDNGDGTYGVDLNRNWGYNWGYDNYGSSPVTGSETYRGTEPFSEPETQHLRDFHLAHDFKIAIYYHSAYNLVIWPWAYNNSPTPDHDIFQRIGDSVGVMNGYGAGLGLIYNVNGGTDDWLYGEQTFKPITFGFTIEVGDRDDDGFWPPLWRIDPLCQENLEPNLFLTKMAGCIDSLYDLRPPFVPDLDAPEFVEEPEYDVSWTFNGDGYNLAAEYELKEMTGAYEVVDEANDFSWLSAFNYFDLSTARYHSSPTSFYSQNLLGGDRFISYQKVRAVEDGDSLKFWTWYDMTSHYCYAHVWVISPTFSGTIPGNLTTTTNLYGNNWGDGITGTSGGWVEAKYDLSQFEGEHITFYILYNTNYGSPPGEGIYIDDIYPMDLFTTEEVFVKGPEEFSHSFTEKENGNYFYSIRAKDQHDQYSVYSNSLKTVVEIPPYICGDANSDAVVDISDAVHLINFVFVPDSPPPDPYDSGNVNCDYILDISDAVHLINFVFVPDSPAPCECR